MVVPVIDGVPQVNASPPIPSAPPAESGSRLSPASTNRGVEQQQLTNDNYISFYVSQNNKGAIVRGERKAIIESDTELTKIVTGGGRKVDGNYNIAGTDKDDFELFIRYLETKFIKFRNAKHALGILEIATRFVCPNLVILCVKELDSILTVLNVVEVFRSLWYYNSITPNKQSIECKRKKNKPQPLITSEEYIAAMLNNCMQLIDMEADTVLRSPELLDLRFEELETIVKREALQFSSELVLFDLLAKWSFKECEKKGLELNAENRRRVLGALCYAPRYLTMASKEFEESCSRVELLDLSEISLIRDEFKGRRGVSAAPEQRTMLNNFKEKRPLYAHMPIHLSQRSDPKNYSKKMRNFDRDKGENCCSNLTLNCISVFACIFD